MELSPAAQKGRDLILERQKEKARGQGEVDKDCRTPPYPRAARAARAARAVPSLQGEEGGGDDEPIATLATRRDVQLTQPIPMISMIPMMPHKFKSGMMLNAHLNNTMPSLPSVLPKAWGGSRH
jgi:hypothetical protein